jgi:hypothetical protein
VGVASEGEWLCIHLREHRDPALVAEKLGVIVEGLAVTGVDVLPLNQRPQESEADVFRLDYAGDASRAADFAAALEKIAAAPSIPWLRTTKSGEKLTDARAYLRAITSCGDSRGLLHLSWENGYVSPLALARACFAHVGAEFAVGCSLTRLRP